MADFRERIARTISLGEHRVASQAFDRLFEEGMGLVERTAAYLDGDGRAECRALGRHGVSAYAAQSMRLTTRLMQLASWLLLQRAVNEGELTQCEAMREKAKVDLGRPEPLDEHEARLLPAALFELIEDTRSLQQRILRLDASLDRLATVPDEPNAVVRQIGLLRAAFEAR